MAKRQALVIGGSSGLGLELALALADKYHVNVTGRKNPERKKIQFFELPLDFTATELDKSFFDLLTTLGRIEICIYAAGFYQEGRVDALAPEEIESMIQVGLLAPAVLLGDILSMQKKLPGFIAVTSTSQWTAREHEPVYTAVKAGLGMLANSISLDERVGKVLVAGPAGMNTPFWNGVERDFATMLDPKWVAEQILELYQGEYKYKFAKILREPPRVEVIETR